MCGKAANSLNATRDLAFGVEVITRVVLSQNESYTSKPLRAKVSCVLFNDYGYNVRIEKRIIILSKLTAQHQYLSCY